MEASHRQLSTTAGTSSVATDYVLDGQSVVQEIKGGATTTYFNGLRGPECRIDSSGNARWNIFDGLGSAVQEVDDAGNVTVVRELDVYGLPRSPEVVKPGETSGKHKFVGNLGHTSEGETGLIYMRARYMDPALGRFISEDPAKDGVNWYAYCGNSPTNGVDPDGRFALLDNLLTTFEGLYNEARSGAAALAAKQWAEQRIAQAVTAHTLQIYNYFLNAGVDDVYLFTSKNGFGWRTADGAVRVFIHIAGKEIMKGKAPHIDYQFLNQKIFEELLKII